MDQFDSSAEVDVAQVVGLLPVHILAVLINQYCHTLIWYSDFLSVLDLVYLVSAHFLYFLFHNHGKLWHFIGWFIGINWIYWYFLCQWIVLNLYFFCIDW